MAPENRTGSVARGLDPLIRMGVADMERRPGGQFMWCSRVFDTPNQSRCRNTFSEPVDCFIVCNGVRSLQVELEQTRGQAGKALKRLGGQDG